MEDREMHLQLRTNARLSPPDVEKVLAVLKDKGVNLLGIGGSDVEFGGELALVPQDDHVDLAKEALTSAGYTWRALEYQVDPELTLCMVENKPGALHDCLAGVADENLAAGRIIRDITILVPDADVPAGKIPVHIYSEQVRTANAMGGSQGGGQGATPS
jgi:hypothetical protein